MTTAAPTAPSNGVAKIDPNKPVTTPADLKRFLEAHVGAIREVAGGVMDPLRMVKILCAAASRNPVLSKCTPLSLLRTLAQGAELGLEVAGQLQEFHPVPYWNSSIGAYEAQGIPGYPGLVKLVLQTGTVARVSAEVVYKSDSFDFALGDHPFITHKPDLSALGDERPDEEIVAFYAIAFFKDGGFQFEVMGRGAVDKLKARALAGKKNTAASPWNTDYAEMGRKTSLRRLCKRLPKTAALARALDLQAQAEAGDFITGEVLDVTRMPDAPDGGGAPPDGAPSGASDAAGPAIVWGESLSEKQVNTAKGHAERLNLNHDGAVRVLAATSNSPKADARAFMDVLFSKDDARIRAAFEEHPVYSGPAPAPAGSGADALASGATPGVRAAADAPPPAAGPATQPPLDVQP